MCASKVINSQSFHDGKVVLYQLEDRPQKRWLCRLKVPNGTGYIYRGTGTSDLFTARKYADELYDELRFKVRTGQAITGQSFKKVIAEFATSFPLQASSQRRADAVIDFLTTYALPYFSKTNVSDLTAAEISKFFDWRRVNTKRKAPSNATIVSEMGKLKVFTDWCVERGHLSVSISPKKPSVSDNRRPHFDSKDWQKLTRYLREWVKAANGKSGSVLRDRTMLINYVLILANTGIRVGEARELRWSDIDSHTGADGNESIILRVKGKTGAREVVSRTVDVKTYLQHIYELRTRELDTKPALTDYIFCHPNGKPIHSFKKGFQTLTTDAGLAFDTNGQRRVIYSLRHTYATFRLQEGVNHYVLAQNMGTSVKMLEAFYGHTSNRAMATELMKSSSGTKKKLPWESQK